MNTITTKDGTAIYFKDWGTGPVVVFSHGWPLNADAWDAQMLFLGQRGYRVLQIDRAERLDPAPDGRSQPGRFRGHPVDQQQPPLMSLIHTKEAT